MKSRTTRKLQTSDRDEFRKWAAGLVTAPSFNWTSEELLETLQQNTAYGIFEESQLMAAVCFLLQETQGEILWLATGSAYRGQGMMQSLLTQAFDDIRRQLRGSFEMFLEVHEKNEKALKLYSLLGFTQVIRRKKYYRDGADALVLSLKLQ